MEDFSLPANLTVLAVEDIQELIEAAREEFHSLNDSDSLEDTTLDRMTLLADAIDSLHDEFVSKVELAVSKRDEISSKVFAAFPGAAAPFKKKGAKADEGMDEGSKAEEDSEPGDAESAEMKKKMKKKMMMADGETIELAKKPVEGSPEEEDAESPEEEASEGDETVKGKKVKKPFPGAAKPFGAAGETVEFADTKADDAIESVRTNISDALSALDASPPDLALARQELHSAQSKIHVMVRVVHPMPEPPPASPEQMAGETETFSDTVTKAEGDENYPASDYAYVPDPQHPSTWKLRLTSSPGGDPDARIVGAAVAALGKGFRGQRVQIPASDLAAVKKKVLAAWHKANPDRSEDQIPSILK